MIHELKIKVLQNKTTLTKFWQDIINPKCNITYFHFMNMLHGRAKIRKDVEEYVQDYLNGRTDV